MTGKRMGAEAGFTLIELLVVTGITLVVLAGTMSIMTSALQSQQTTQQMLDMNSHLRAAMDLVQRDLLQVGQGLPVGRRVGIPSADPERNPRANPIRRPGPGMSGECPGVTTFPPESSLPALSVGAGLGPPLNGVCTDVITILAADNMVAQVPVAAIAANGGSAVIHESVNIDDDPDEEGDNLRAGDLLMFYKGTVSVLTQVTEVDGQTVTFGTDPDDDPLGLNQSGPTVLGTVDWYNNVAPADWTSPQVDANGVERQGPSQATRIRMITYFVDIETDETTPRLMRIVGGGAANAVALGVQAFQLTYDLTDQINNPTAVRMTTDDLEGRGACPDNPETEDVEGCSENQIRKVNVLLSMDASLGRARTARGEGRQSQNTLYTQVSLRSMAFVDRYR